MTQNVELKKITKKKKVASLDKKKARAGWIFVLPFLIGLVLIYIPIIYDSISTSLLFRDKDPVTGAFRYTFG